MGTQQWGYIHILIPLLLLLLPETELLMTFNSLFNSPSDHSSIWYLLFNTDYSLSTLKALSTTSSNHPASPYFHIQHPNQQLLSEKQQQFTLVNSSIPHTRVLGHPPQFSILSQLQQTSPSDSE